MCAANPFDDYLERPEPAYAWHDTGARVTPKLSDATAHILNVTSLAWLDENKNKAGVVVLPSGLQYKVLKEAPKKHTQLRQACAAVIGEQCERRSQPRSLLTADWRD